MTASLALGELGESDFFRGRYQGFMLHETSTNQKLLMHKILLFSYFTEYNFDTKICLNNVH